MGQTNRKRPAPVVNPRSSSGKTRAVRSPAVGPCAWRLRARADIFTTMPPKKQHSKPVRQKSLQQLVEDVGLYPPEAYEFIQKGLSFTVQRVHGELKEAEAAESK